MSEIEKGKAGQLFSDFLKEQGTYDVVTKQAAKRVIAYQLSSAMQEKGIAEIRMTEQLDLTTTQPSIR